MKVSFGTEVITPRITRLLLPGNVFAYLVQGSERAMLIDTGLGAGDLRAFAESLLGGKPYEVILTHGHLDHAGGASQFERVWLREEDVPMASGDNLAARADYLRSNGFAAFEESELDASRTGGYSLLKYGQRFDLGGEELKIVCLGGHTAGSVGILFREERILLAGDACCSFTLLLGAIGSLQLPAYREHLLAAWESYHAAFDSVLYSHPHNYGGPEVIPQMIELCGEVLQGTDDRIPMDFMGRPGRLAKAMGKDMKRTDGKIANLVYAAG